MGITLYPARYGMRHDISALRLLFAPQLIFQFGRNNVRKLACSVLVWSRHVSFKGRTVRY